MFRADNKMLGSKLCFNFGLMFLLFHIADGVKVAGQYYVSKNTSTWMQASRQCSLATPSVDSHTFAADIPVNLITEDLWVGYYLKHKAFEYIGCITTNGYSAKLSNIDMNLRICQSACGDVMDIGINKKACYCLNTKPLRDIHQSGCVDTCGKSSVCGGKGYMSLYKSVKDSNISTDDPGLCLKYENNERDKYFVWDNCDKSFKTICSYDNGTVRLLNDNSLPWEKSVQGCLQTHGLPTSLSSSRSVVEVTGPVWTGIIKSLVIYKLDETFLKSQDGRFGFLSRERDTAALKFGWSPGELRALCNHVMPVLTGNKTQDNGMTKDIGLIVGVTVPLILVVTAFVVVLVVFIRRGRVPYICKRKGSISSEYVNTNTSVPDKSTSRAHINQAYDQFDKTVQQEHVDCGQETQKDDTSHAHDYFVLEKEMSSPEDSTYDSTVNGQSAAKRENVNVYNTTESGSTYDFTFHRGLNKELGISNKYDSLENTLTGSSSYKTTYQPYDDTYNHTKGMQKVKNVKTDNIYGTQMRNFDQNDTSDQDTYNHLNSKPNVKPDQIYGIPEK